MPLASVHFDKLCVLTASHFQAAAATINTGRFFFFFFLSFPARGPGLIPSRTPASSLPPGAWKRGRAQTNRNSDIYGSSPWALHLPSVTPDLKALCFCELGAGEICRQAENVSPPKNQFLSYEHRGFDGIRKSPLCKNVFVLDSHILMLWDCRLGHSPSHVFVF